MKSVIVAQKLAALADLVLIRETKQRFTASAHYLAARRPMLSAWFTLRPMPIRMMQKSGKVGTAEFNVSEVCFECEGSVFRLRRSKTNPYDALEEFAVVYGSDPQNCAVRQMQAWLEISGKVSIPLFRAADRAGRIWNGPVRGAHRARTANNDRRLPLAEPEQLPCFATLAARAKKSGAAITRDGLWKSTTVARRCSGAGLRTQNHACASVGVL